MLCHHLAASMCHCFEISGDPAADRGAGKPAHVAMPLAGRQDKPPANDACSWLTSWENEYLSALPCPAQTAHPPLMSIPMLKLGLLHLSCELPSQQSCCDWSPARFNLTEFLSGRHYVGTTIHAPPARKPPARRISFVWRPTYTLTYYGPCTPTYDKPHHHHPKALEFPPLRQLINLWLIRHPLPLLPTNTPRTIS